MCTVTIVPKGHNDFILTTNRDEAPERISSAPKFIKVNGVEMLFPKDEQSGGTWIGVSEKQRLVCVLNGGFINHQRKSIYRKSRGVVAKDFLACANLEQEVIRYDFNGIEPFTLIIADWNLNLRFFELVWSGEKINFEKLSLEPHIWSSSTLYSETMKKERAHWFGAFKNENELNAKKLLQFHKTAGRDTMDYGVIMDRGFVKTTSITQVEKKGNLVTMRYENLQKNTSANKSFHFSKTQKTKN